MNNYWDISGCVQTEIECPHYNAVPRVHAAKLCCGVELQQGHIDTSECAKLSKKRSKIDSPDTKLLGTARNTMSLERNPGVMNTENMIVFI